MDVIPVRIGKGLRKHALPQAGTDRELTLCRRPAARSTIDDGFPTCRRCLRAIERLSAAVVTG